MGVVVVVVGMEPEYDEFIMGDTVKCATAC
jgi:hypothetical protein